MAAALPVPIVASSSSTAPPPPHPTFTAPVASISSPFMHSSPRLPAALPHLYFRPTLLELCVPLLARQPHDILLPLLLRPCPSLSFLPSSSCPAATSSAPSPSIYIPAEIRSLLISRLPLKLPLDQCAKYIEDDEYWQRRSSAKWNTSDTSCHGRSWKQLFFERNLADELECFDPTYGDGNELIKLLEISEPFVHNLQLCQLPSHLSPSVILGALGRNLASLKLEYGWRNARMLYEPAKFGMKFSDCLAFSASISIASTLSDLDLSSNLLDDKKVEILLKGMLKNPILVQLNLSHNRIGDSGVAELAKYLLSNKCVLGGLNLCDNYFLTQAPWCAIRERGRVVQVEDDGPTFC